MSETPQPNVPESESYDHSPEAIQQRIETDGLRNTVIKVALERGLPNPLLTKGEATAVEREAMIEEQFGEEADAVLGRGGDHKIGFAVEARHKTGRGGKAFVDKDYEGDLGGGSPKNPIRIGGITHI